MHSSSAEAERLCNLENASAGRQLRSDMLDNIAAHWTTAKLLPLAPYSRETSIGDISGK
jgi:hypothetical protein